MERELLIHLPVILTVARRGGFAAAASTLGMSPSAVSHAVRLVEQRLGQPLFHRTTRSVRLTEAGAELLATLGPALDSLEDGLAQLHAAKGRVTGTLRLNTPRAILAAVVTPIIQILSQAHPELIIDVTADEALTDIVAAGYDAGIRMGEMIAQDMVTIRLTPPWRTALAASPAYLTAHGTPEHIADLSQHNCINYRLLAADTTYGWELQEGGRDITVTVKGTIRVSDATYARELALEGIGIAYLFEPLIRNDLATGRLMQILPASAIEEPGLFLYFPRHAAKAPKLRAFIEAACHRLGTATAR
jgi:DNA-binding transcriptional LysR family regulator